MTKKERIRALYEMGIPPKVIAETVGCHRDYVRVAARQRANGPSASDVKYRPKRLARNRQRYRDDPVFRERTRARVARWQQKRKAQEAAA